MTTPQPIIAITPGEPAGIGPDLVLKLAKQSFAARLVVIADPALLASRAQQLGVSVKLQLLSDFEQAQAHQPGMLQIISTLKSDSLQLALDPNNAVIAGKLSTQHAPYVMKSLTLAARAYLTGAIDAIVTGPVHKGIINQAGIAFSGHTGFFAGFTNHQAVMMLVSPQMRVALATTHLPLAKVPQAIQTDSLNHTLTVLQRDLQRFYNIAEPKIYVAGLNPHAGEDGHLGREEIDIIIPAIQQAQQRGIKVFGPYPADTLFTPQYLEQADVILAMYHDQGLAVLKHSGFGQAVNVTLGLPILRTSVDHGTALPLAGQGLDQLNDTSFQYAIEHAISMAQTKAQR